MNRTQFSVSVFFLVLCLSNSFAQGNRLVEFDSAENAEAGTWSKSENGEVKVAAGQAARAVAVTDVPLDYDLVVEFTRTAGEDTVLLILPIGDVSPALEIGGWGGETHGLSRVDGLPTRDPKSPAVTRPGKFENGKRQQVSVSVRSSGAEPSIAAKLNGNILFEWTGNANRLSENVAFNLVEKKAIGLAAQQSDVTFHRLLLKPVASKSPLTTAPKTTETEAKSGTLELLGAAGSVGWESFNGAAFLPETNGGKFGAKANPAVGSKYRGAFLVGSDFSEGTIEIDLKGANQPGGSFVGVVFHGVDGKTYDSVYFRPFNFGHADPVRRGHAVQYMSHPNFPWDKLRADQPEVFENPATPEPKPGDWFHAKIEIKDDRIRTFVNGAEKPCLDVEKLGDITTGKVGVWFNGVASFANLKVTPK